MKTSRVAMSDQLLEISQHCQATDFVNFLTGDKSWFFLSILMIVHYGVWAASRDEVQETLMTKIGIEKCMISIPWSISGIHSLFALNNSMKHSFKHFCQHVIPDIQQNICASSGRKPLKDIL
jgi:hypothetical protein